jgi:hypothetical protein
VNRLERGTRRDDARCRRRRAHDPPAAASLARLGCSRVGVALFIPYADFFALLLTLIWILIVSVLLWRSHDTAASGLQPV